MGPGIGGKLGEGWGRGLDFVFWIAGPVQDGLQGTGGVLIAAAQGMGVGLQRHGGVAMAQAGGHGHGVDIVGQQDGGVGVPLRYNNDKRKKP